MTFVFAIPLIAGTIAVLMWIAASATAANVDGWEAVDPERRFGRPGRFVVALLFGFGMTGISALYAGWTPALSILAGAAGGLALIAAANWLGPEDV
jgi:hypothetical protein